MDITFGEYRLTTDHAASSYGIPVLLIAGKAHGIGDLSPEKRLLVSGAGRIAQAQGRLTKEQYKAVLVFLGLRHPGYY
jgi:D-aminopeptidase